MNSAVFAGYSTVTLILLMLTFRIAEFMRSFHFNKFTIIASYIIVAVMLSLIAVVLAPAVTRLLAPKLGAGSWRQSVASAALTFLSFCLISLLFGPGGFEIPGMQVRGIFFSEWDFIRFILYDGIFLAALGGVVMHFVKE